MSAAKVSPMRPDTSTSYLRKVRLFVINFNVDIYNLILIIFCKWCTSKSMIIIIITIIIIIIMIMIMIINIIIIRIMYGELNYCVVFQYLCIALSG